MMYVNGQAVCPTQTIIKEVPKISGYITSGLVYDFQFRKFPSYDEISNSILECDTVGSSIDLTNVPCINNIHQTNNSQVRITELTQCKGSTNFTISIWHKKTNSVDSNLRSIIETGKPDTYSGKSPALMTYTDGKLFFSAYYADITTNIVYPLNEWHNVVVTSDGTTVKLYYDGTLVGQISTTVTMCTSDYCKCSISRTINGDGATTGYYGNLLIYNRALTDAEILSNYNSTKGYFGVN